MSEESVQFASVLRRDGRIILAFHKLLPYLKQLVLQSRFIETENKDGIISDLEKLNDTIRDAYRRSVGTVPYTKKQLKQRKDIQCRMFPNSLACKKKPTM